MVLQNLSTSKLNQIALKHKTDKSSKHHNYVVVYEKLLHEKRNDELSVLELGWGGHEHPKQGGASALMWRDYLPNSTITCIDIEEKVLTEKHHDINFRQGSQANPEFISSLASEFGPFDFIVDDASHVSSLTIKSWELLYPHLKDGGLYVVEDIHSSLHDFWYGDEEANRDPYEKTSIGVPTALQYFQSLSSEVYYTGRGESDWDLFPRKYWKGYSLEYVTFMHDLVIIRKRGNGTWPV